MAQNLEVGDIVLCTVDRIVGTVVFVKIDGNGEGGIIMSEIAPGRIRNLLDYVVPKKRIACKVLRISEGRIDLSLRRVTQKEQKEIIEQENQEKSSRSILRTVLGEALAEEKISQILHKGTSLHEFLLQSKEHPKKLDEFFKEEYSKKILEILRAQKQKKAEIKKEIILTSNAEDGLNKIKKTLSEKGGAKIKYLSGGKYSIQIEDANLKKADNSLRLILQEIEKKAKQEGLQFAIKER
jgi:translation initiation factor 2 alpha subunit (eIF-2alpha)